MLLKKFMILAIVAMIAIVAGCSKPGDRASNAITNPAVMVNAGDLVQNGNLYFPDDFSNVIGTSDTVIIDQANETVSSSTGDEPIRKIILPDGTEYTLVHPVIDLANMSAEDQTKLRQMVPGACALGADITNYYLKDNQWVYAVIMESSDQAWVFYNPRKAGYKTLKFKNNIVWNYEVLMLPAWRNATSGWNQWTAWWCAPWYQYKTLYSGSADIAYLFVVVQNNDKSASVMITAY